MSVAVGLASGNGLSRSLAFGLYVVGCARLVIGFALADAALFVVLGIVLLVLGVLSDTRYPLF
ncbi:MAG: hypothetical protein QOI43_1119 [Gaiellales bacterium]|nr:hypothetical protein [Gaiellales bacterium]